MGERERQAALDRALERARATLDAEAERGAARERARVAEEACDVAVKNGVNAAAQRDEALRSLQALREGVRGVVNWLAVDDAAEDSEAVIRRLDALLDTAPEEEGS